MNLSLAAKSGWGKSYHAQAWMEANIENYETAAIMDYCDEYRGLVKQGLASYWIIGPHEVNQWGPTQYRNVLKENGAVVFARHERVDTDAWQQVVADVATVAPRLRSSLVCIDEAHFVAPQAGKLPDPIQSLATTARGAGTSCLTITQRPANVDKDFFAQAMARIFGGFGEGNDLDAVGRQVEYPQGLHNPQEDPNPSVLTDELLPADRERPTSLQKHEDATGSTVGSEWIYSDDSGDLDRLDTRGVTMQSTHYGQEGKDLEKPEYT